MVRPASLAGVGLRWRLAWSYSSLFKHAPLAAPAPASGARTVTTAAYQNSFLFMPRWMDSILAQAIINFVRSAILFFQIVRSHARSQIQQLCSCQALKKTASGQQVATAEVVAPSGAKPAEPFSAKRRLRQPSARLRPRSETLRKTNYSVGVSSK